MKPLSTFFKPTSQQTPNTTVDIETDSNQNLPECYTFIASYQNVTNPEDRNKNIQGDINGNFVDDNTISEVHSVQVEDDSEAGKHTSASEVGGAHVVSEQDQAPSDEPTTIEVDDNPLNSSSEEAYIEKFIKNKLEQLVDTLNFANSKRQYTDQNIRRTWIFYREKLGKMFCVCCKFFADKSAGPFIKEGFDDWRHPNRISEHEKSKSHCDAAFVFAKRLQKCCKVDTELEKQTTNDKKYWREVLKRLLSVIRFLSSRGLPFRDENENIVNSHNGNYLGALDFLSEYDSFLRTHLDEKANKGKGSVSYLSSTIADELIALLANTVRQLIVKAVAESKYFSLVIDSTLDISHIDQLTVCLRYVNHAGLAVERFLAFLANPGHKGKEMQFEVVKFLKGMKIITEDCRGQSYDNAPNMSGIYAGLQALIKTVCPFAEYVPCSPHTLNLTLQNAAESVPEVVRFFLFVQNIYTFFSASARRWKILLDYLTFDLQEKRKQNPQERLLVPKKLSDTRWSARHESCRALRTGYKSFVDALMHIMKSPEEKKITQIEAESLYQEFFKLETAICVEFWSTILNRVNVTSKSLQHSWIDIETTVRLYQSLSNYIKELRNEESFNSFVERGKALVSSCLEWETNNPELSYNCFGKRVRKRNTRYDVGNGEETFLSHSQNYRFNVYYGSLDSMISDLTTQTDAYEKVLTPFSFMFNMDKLTNTEIRQCSSNLLNRYPGDLDEDFADECLHFKHLMTEINAAIETDLQSISPEKDDKNENSSRKTKQKLVSKPSRMLQYIKLRKLQHTFPNVDVALRIFECLAVANATGERSFSALKRIKNELRSTLGNEKMNDLSILFIENDLLQEIDDEKLINEFTDLKCRKVTF